MKSITLNQPIKIWLKYPKILAQRKIESMFEYHPSQPFFHINSNVFSTTNYAKKNNPMDTLKLLTFQNVCQGAWLTLIVTNIIKIQ